jgi:hypothetical protein
MRAFLHICGDVLSALLMTLAAAAVGAALVEPTITFGRDDGRYANTDPKLKAWFDKLRSDKGLCCSFADGVAIADVDWDTLGSRDNGGSGYRVRLNGAWIEVPMTAVVISEDRPKSFQDAVVWPYTDNAGAAQIRCFVPGSGA